MSSQDLFLIRKIIDFSGFITNQEKEFLLANLERLSPLEVLKIKRSILAKSREEFENEYKKVFSRISENRIAKVIVESQPLLRADPVDDKIVESEKNIKEIKNTAPNNQSKVLMSESLLLNEFHLGHGKVSAIIKTADKLTSLHTITSLDQLHQISIKHIDFGLDDNAEQQIQLFFQEIKKLFLAVDDIEVKRSYLLTFLQSPLFGAYLNTGLTALQHPEIKPSAIILNTLHKNNEQYLSKKQFQYAALITGQIRKLAYI